MGGSRDHLSHAPISHWSKIVPEVWLLPASKLQGWQLISAASSQWYWMPEAESKQGDDRLHLCEAGCPSSGWGESGLSRRETVHMKSPERFHLYVWNNVGRKHKVLRPGYSWQGRPVLHWNLKPWNSHYQHKSEKPLRDFAVHRISFTLTAPLLCTLLLWLLWEVS